MTVNFERLEHVLSRSAVARTIQWLLCAVSAAFRGSALNAAIVGVRQGARALPGAVRVRLVGCALLTFVLVHIILLAAIPENVAPAMPAVVWVVVAFIALLLMGAPSALIRAWRTRRRIER